MSGNEHMVSFIIDNNEKNIEFFDPSFNSVSVYDYLIPLLLCYPEVFDYQFTVVVDYSIQELSNYSSYIDNFCMLWSMHYIYFRFLMYGTTEQYKQMFDTLYTDKSTHLTRASFNDLMHNIKSDASNRLKDEIIIFLTKFLSKDDIESFRQIQENLKNKNNQQIQYGGTRHKYMKYKFKYLNLKNNLINI